LPAPSAAVCALGGRRDLPYFGARASVIVAPVISWGRCLAVLELVDPAHGGRFDVHAEDALSYVAARFADFIADHGLDRPDGVHARG
jgi:hypothetical protein